VRGTFVVSEPGEVIQVDIKSLGRLVRGGGKYHGSRRRDGSDRAGWEHAHVAVDAASRATYIELRAGLGSLDCAAFIRGAVAHFDALGIRVQRVLTDNGTGYKRIFGDACADLALRWTRTKPYHPWTNGRAERFIRTLQGECLYEGEHFASEDDRRYAVARWLAFYNGRRPHTALGGLTPEAWLRARRVTNV
jgi:Integrase core domain